jgi:polyhydroxybutyrate depolymerase
MFRLVVLAAALFWPALLSAGTETISFQLDGQVRRYIVHAPDTGTGRAMPLVLMLHGGFGSASQILRHQGGEMNRLAEEAGFIVVYPEAVGRSWDFGEGAVSAGRRGHHVDDLAYLTAVIDRVAVAYPVDRERVFATGISQGGQASFFLACKRPGLIRAIAPVSMSLPDFLADDCARMPPTPVLMMNGTADRLVPYDGGPITVDRRDRGNVLGAEATLALLRQRNGCSGAPVTKRIGSVERREWSCAAPLVHYKIGGGGHNWPPYGGTLRKDGINTDIHASVEVLAFFSRL